MNLSNNYCLVLNKYFIHFTIFQCFDIQNELPKSNKVSFRLFRLEVGSNVQRARDVVNVLDGNGLHYYKFKGKYYRCFECIQ